MSYLFIDDGFELDGYIRADLPLPPAKPNHPELRFRYRPLRDAQRKRHLNDNERLSPEDQTTHNAKMLEKQIASWSAGRPASAENIARLNPALLGRLTLIVMGITAPDEDPQTPPKESERVPLVEAKVVANNGGSFQGAREAQAEKN